MNKKLNIGDYVRTKNGEIGKIIDKYKVYDYYKIKVDIRNGFIEKHREDLFRKHIKKSSPNIIDLIEVRDYVNGYDVEYVDYKDKMVICYGATLDEEDIKSIVTKEQFESMEYKIGE